MHSWVDWALLATAAALATPALAQNSDTPPTITNVEWEISRYLGGDVFPLSNGVPAFCGNFSAPGGNYGNYEPFVPDDPSFLAYELDVIRLSVTVTDPDFVDEGSGSGDPIDPVQEPGDELFYLNTSLGSIGPPEAPPITKSRNSFVPADEGLAPATGEVYTIVECFRLPEFNGKNQDRLRGDISWDVFYTVFFYVANSQSPCDVDAYGFLSNCEEPVVATSGTIFVLENPLLPPVNPTAFADAGADQLVEVGQNVTLDGSRTFDSFNVGFDDNNEDVFEKDTLSFTWEWISGPVDVDPTQSAATEPTAELTFDEPGTYVYRLTVDDNFNALPTTDSVTITVVEELPDENPPFVVITGPAGAVSPGAFVTLDASDSGDPDGDELTFRWVQVNAIGDTLEVDEFSDKFQALSGADTDTVSWQALQEGTFYFRLLLSDGQFITTSDVFTVEVALPETAGVTFVNPSTSSDTDSSAGAGDVSSEVGDGSGGLSVPFIPTCGTGLLPALLAPLGLLFVRRRDG